MNMLATQPTRFGGPLAGAILAAATVLQGPAALASSHREGPFIAMQRAVDGTDFYMFRSYEPGREHTVTLLANYIPFQDPEGGPNFYQFDPDALYEIHIDNNGDAVEDLTFRFRMTNTIQDVSIPTGLTQPRYQSALLDLAVDCVAVEEMQGLGKIWFHLHFAGTNGLARGSPEGG